MSAFANSNPSATPAQPLAHIAVGCAPEGEVDEGTFNLETLSGCLRAAWFLSSLDDQTVNHHLITRLVELDWHADSNPSRELSAEERTAEWARAHALISEYDPKYDPVSS